jgi:hypothetical protein
VAGELPQPIARALRRLIHRVRGVILLRGVSAVIATAFGSLLLVMAIDAGFMLFSQWARWALTLMALGATLGVAAWLLVAPLARTITLTGIARAIEERHPELQERLSSTVELLTSRDIPELRGSEALIAALAAEASHDAQHMKPRSEIPLRSARPFILAALGIIAVLAALFLIYPAITTRLLQRAVAPFWNLPNIHADMLTVTPGDAQLLEGQRLQVHVTVSSKHVSAASFRKTLPDGTEVAERMTELPPTDEGYPRFMLTCPPASETFRYRVHAGDALTRHYTATVVPPATVKRIDARFQYPGYTSKEAVTVEDISGDLRAVAGTKVAVSAVTNKPVKAAELRLNGQPVPTTEIRLTPNPDGTTVLAFDIDLKARLRGRWALQMTDEFGFTNTSPEHLVEALADKPPTARILAPEAMKLKLKPSDRLPLAYAMTDDFGISRADWVVETDARKQADVKVDLPPLGQAENLSPAGEVALPLTRLPLQGAKMFTLRLRARDNLPGDARGPQQGLSQVITVELDLTAESFAMQALKAEEEAVRKSLEKIVRELQETKKDSVPVKEQADKAQELQKEVAERLERMREHLAAADATAAALEPQIREGSFQGLEPKMEQLGQEVDAAQADTGDVKLGETPTQRAESAKQADQHVDKATELAKEMLRDLEKMNEALQLAQALSDMAAQEADLAAQQAAAESAQAQASPEWQQAQDAMAQSIGEMVKDMPAAMQAQLAQDQAAAQNLAQEARELQQQQQALQADTAQSQKMSQTDQALKDLAAEQAALARETGSEPFAQPQAQPMGQAAQNIQAGNLNQAVDQQKAAENALNQMAKGEQPSGQQPAGEQPAGQQPAGEQPAGEQPAGQQPLTPQQQERAGQLAQKQTDLRKRTEELQAQRAALAQQMTQSQMARLQQEQAQLAREATQLAESAAPAGQQAAQTSEQAAHNAQAAAEQLPQNVPAAAQSASQAAEQLSALAQNLGQQAAEQASGQQPSGEQPSGEQPSGQQPNAGQTGEMAQQAGDLAERQAQLAAQMQALAQGNPMQALAAEQSAIAAQTADLQEAAAALGQRAQAMAPQTAQQAGQAQQALGQAQAAEGQAQQALESGQPQAATPPQGQAAEALGQAADALSQMSQALAQAAGAMPSPSPAEAAMGQPMAEAYGAASEAASEPSAASAAQAAQALAQAAGQAAAQAQAMGAQPGMAGQMAMQPGQVPGQTPESKMGIGSVNLSLTAAKLQAMGIKLSDWAKLPGELRNQILQAAEEGGPEEYRTLIKKYFQKVAQKGSAAEEQP